MDAWIQTYTGRQFWPLTPSASDVDIEDIAHALAMKCRYNGHTSEFYSVAEHCVLLSRAINAYQLWGLLHDAAEAYLPDVSRPIKGSMTGFAAIEAGVMDAVCTRFWLPYRQPLLVTQADTAILHDEKAALLPATPADWRIPEEPLGVKIRCWSPTEAKVQFLARFKELQR